MNNALDFLDKLCTVYEQRYLASSGADDNTKAFLDEVYGLAEANKLPSKAFKSVPEFSAKQLRKHANKVCDCLLPFEFQMFILYCIGDNFIFLK